MSMNLFGTAPTSASGQSLDFNTSMWCHLWDFCCEVSAASRQVTCGYSNDGDGLNAAGACSLASDLLDAIKDGRAAEFERRPDLEQARAETEEALIFARLPENQHSKRTAQRAKLAALLGGAVPFETTVRRFADFLEHSGGFEIW